MVHPGTGALLWASGPGNAEHGLAACCNRDEIPLALVALDANERVVGTAALKPHSLETHRHLTQWLVALLVVPGQRCKGIAWRLIAAIEDEARRLGCSVLYSDTAGDSTLLRRRRWPSLEADIPIIREPATFYRLELQPVRE